MWLFTTSGFCSIVENPGTVTPVPPREAEALAWHAANKLQQGG